MARNYMVSWACGHRRRLQGETSEQCATERAYADKHICLQCQSEVCNYVPATLAPTWLVESTFNVRDGKTVGHCVYPDCVKRTYGTDHHYECARQYYLFHGAYLHLTDERTLGSNIRAYDGTLYDCLVTIAEYRDCSLHMLVAYTKCTNVPALRAWFVEYLKEYSNMFPNVRAQYLS